MKTIAKNADTVIFESTGSADVLQIKNLTIPAPAPDEVRIVTKALGLNRADVMYRNGAYLEHPVFPARIGNEASGVVDAVGENVTHIQPGDRVSIIPAFSLNQYAMHGELVLAPAYAVEKIPDSLTFQKAAALWSTYLTAYGLLIDQAGVQTGQYVLINAASSSVGITAIQIANAAGAIPIAISTSAAKRAALLEAGAAHVIVSSAQDIAEEVSRITDHKGANIILDAVGGPAFSSLLAAAALKARVLIYGTLSPEPATFNTWEILRKNVQISGFTVADVNIDPSRLQAAKTFIYEGLASGKLDPVIAGSFTLDAIADAHRFLESNKQVGKVIISL